MNFAHVADSSPTMQSYPGTPPGPILTNDLCVPRGGLIVGYGFCVKRSFAPTRRASEGPRLRVGLVQPKALAYASGWCSRKPSLTRRVGAAESPRLRVGLVQPKALAYASGWCSRKPSLTRRVGAAESPRL